jgi:DNA-binding NtrC family response regulator
MVASASVQVYFQLTTLSCQNIKYLEQAKHQTQSEIARNTLSAATNSRASSDAEFAKLGLVGTSPSFATVLAATRRLAACDATVIVTGESGTGKELIARALHYLGPRRGRPFVPVNCGALPEGLFENEVFGHVRGAYTHASTSQLGLVEQANGGTLLFDEIDALSPRSQAALLRFLEDRAYRPLGADRARTADVRVIAATNADLSGRVVGGHFRADLLHRLEVLNLHLPALRERVEDIGPLAEHFLSRLTARYGGPAKHLTGPCLSALAAKAWPGNVRELENWLHRRWLLSDGSTIEAEEAPLDPAPPSLDAAGFQAHKAAIVAAFERSYLEGLLRQHAGNISGASREAAKERKTFKRLLAKHGISPDAYRIAAER